MLFQPSNCTVSYFITCFHTLYSCLSLKYNFFCPIQLYTFLLQVHKSHYSHRTFNLAEFSCDSRTILRQALNHILTNTLTIKQCPKPYLNPDTNLYPKILSQYSPVTILNIVRLPISRFKISRLEAYMSSKRPQAKLPDTT